MIRSIPLLCMVAVLFGCASLTYPLPKCDGYERRPLNRSLWQWEENSNIKREHSNAYGAAAQPVVAAYLEEGKAPPAFVHLDAKASQRPCEG